MNRRGFLQSILAIGAAPAIVRAESLMKLWVPPQGLLAERPLPRVMRSHDFTNAVFTRSTTATMMGVDGILITVGKNVPRFISNDELRRITA